LRPTGIDRVERAYLHHLNRSTAPLYLLARTPMGYVLTAPEGAQTLDARLRAEAPPGPSDLLSRVIHRSDPVRAAAETDLRRLRLDRCPPPALRSMLARHLPRGFAYVNVGHSNLTSRVLSAVGGTGGRITVMLHDAIPLTHPELQRSETPERFRRMLDRVAATADGLVYTSKAARADIARHLPSSRVRQIVAPLGIDRVAPRPQDVPPDLDLSRPYFVTLGTIEPRKGHAFLLDLWQALAAEVADCPRLYICGARGWADPAVLARLDGLPPGGPVRELSGLSDGAVAALLDAACGLLSASLAEGFGLPVVEAAARGCPVVCTPLPAHRETLGTTPIYAADNDTQAWTDAILRLSRTRRLGPGAAQAERFQPPDWDAHFKTVLNFS
jgi:glycosyltransferase involved in cell wall biosynthesis